MGHELDEDFEFSVFLSFFLFFFILFFWGGLFVCLFAKLVGQDTLLKY